MISDARILFLRSILRHRRELVAAGLTDRRLDAGLREGSLLRAHPGWYVSASEWSALNSAEQHLLRALAVAANAEVAPVFSHATAAILHGLPLYGLRDRRVHATVGRPVNRRSSEGVFRHRLDLAADHVTERAGLRCTTVSRTVLDIARTMSIESGIVCADAGFRQLASASADPPDEVLARLLEQLDSSPPSPGRARARRVLEIADSAAESPLESLSRLQLLRLGFEVESQVPVRSSDGGSYFMDFELLGHDAFAEVDGAVKYTDERLRAGRTAEQVVLEEKAREDWVRGTTCKRVLRWGWRDAQSHSRLAQRLREFGVVLPAAVDRPRHLHLFSPSGG